MGAVQNVIRQDGAVHTGQVVRPQQIFAGIGLLGIQSELEIKTSTHLLGLVRAIANIKK
ncbi:hypothetical protein VCHA43P273_220064 [Vibrio chagasii]|nr:hypothetical protein VCHA43P273_220064 [Vibrio chagasii]